MDDFGSNLELRALIDEIDDFKHVVFADRPYASRASRVLTLRLAEMYVRRDYFFNVLDEIDFLEGLRPSSSTKEPTPFKHPSLVGFWHKHFTTPRHIIANIYRHWGLAYAAERGGELPINQGTRFDKMAQQVAAKYGDDPEKWPGVVAHSFVIEGYKARARRKHKLTGDWIIFAIHDGERFYLDLATHAEGGNETALYEKLRIGSEHEWPFLFERARTDQI